jgi:AraC-like DNA-binding protein
MARSGVTVSPTAIRLQACSSTGQISKMKVPVIRDADQKIERCIAHILGHLNERVKVAELAGMANLSSARFTGLFKQKTGLPPMNFIVRLRMHQACHLLKISNLSVREIAATLGYQDPCFFSRQFKLINGVAPKNYRMTGPGVVPPIPRISASITRLNFKERFVSQTGRSVFQPLYSNSHPSSIDTPPR